MDMFSEGDTVAAYELIRRLGGGAFGEVWLVRHMDLGVERAMKVPTDPDYVRQLRQEGKIQFQLRHPNIVETVDLNTMHDPPYFVMEYVEGQDLRKRLKADGKLPVDEALEIVGQVLDALTHAHSQGVLHRDLKPENILLTPDGRVKITDFGLGKVQAEVAQSLLLSGSMMSSQGVSVSGTFQYMSPEQQSGRDADPRDDLYSVGIIACELLTGRRPSGLGVFPAFERSGVDRSIAEVFAKALDDREYRYTGAAEMGSAVTVLMRELADQRERQRREEERRRLEAERREEAQQLLLAQRQRAEQDRQRRAKEQKRREEQRRAAERERQEEQPHIAQPTQLSQPQPEAVRPRHRLLKRMAIGVLLMAVIIYAISRISEPTSSRPLGPTRSDVTVRTSLSSDTKSLDFHFSNGVTMKLVRIEAGKFTMGSPETEKDRSKDEGPQRRVTISTPFYMGVTEVTQAQWQAVMNTQPWEGQTYVKAGADNAASWISWDNAAAFCKALSKKAGRAVRLPTEAEWEYACRSGTTTAYGFGDDSSNLGDYAWYGGNAYNMDDKYAHPVGVKKPNAWGLYDMHGNVWEWCADWYADSYANADTRDPKGPSSGEARVLRGGSWDGHPQNCRAAYRYGDSPGGRDIDSGFRVVVLPGVGVD